MVIYNILLDILKYSIAGIGIVWVAFYMVKPYLDKNERLQILELKKAADSQTLPLRLQGYERLVIFIERINPSNLLLRLNNTAYTASQLHHLAVSEIREEYQHNITQQIYVSGRAWAVVKRMKDDSINILNNTLTSLPETATGLDLSRAILTRLSELEESPYDVAAMMIQKDLEAIFNY
jgi:hypothetical protein